MRLPKASLRCVVLLFGAILAFPFGRAAAQTTNIPARIAQAVDERNLVVLPGNVHPLARLEFDQGAVADAQPLQRMLLLLQRSPDQEAALRQLLDDQQSKASPNYHSWLTPDQFGEQFGPADADIQAVTQWLTSQGFTDIKVGPGRTVIEFSGNVAQVRNAFHTQIHGFVVNNEERMANASDPQIPAALARVVAGVVSLHNFPRKSHARVLGQFRRAIGRAGLEPLFTFPNPFNGKNFYGLGPGDFATIYNSKPLIAAGNDGTGQTIAIVGETNLNVQDVQQFRTMFGLPPNFDATNVILNGEDPGITSIGEEGEADLDVEWSGAAAPGATIKYVLSASTPASAGVDLSALYIVEHNLAGVMSESYGACEKDLGSAGNAFYNTLWEQAAAQGITVLLSSGDGGTAGCDNFNSQPIATQGLAVSGLASTPFNVSVGGTDFDQVNNWAAYWNPTNDPTGTSAKSYIPEIPWSENCAQIALTGCGASAPNGSVNIVAGSGGASSLYGKPKWQMGVTGVPNDNHRDQPDISLFASPGFDGTGYVYCQSDQTISGARACDLNASNGILDFGIVGGTSASAPAFAGIMALVNQYQAAHGGTNRQGNANYVLYALAKKAGASCTSSATEAAGCVFNDVTKGNSALPTGLPGVGTNSVPCQGGSLNCSVSTTGSRGVLVDPSHTTTEAWTATAGYDMTTGLGTVNANNLATNWGSVSTVPTTTTLTLLPTTGITHGTSENVTVGITVKPTTGTGVAAGDVSLIATPIPPDGITRGLDQFTLANGAVTDAKTQSLPGGTYTVSAHYAGDGTNAPSDSTPIQVTVGKESSQTFIVVPSFDSQGNLLNGNATSVTYGSRYIIRMYVTDKNGVASATGPPTPTCYQENVLTCPSGTVALTDNGALVDTGGGGPGVYNLNDFGYTRNLTPSLLGGVHSLVSTYSGDNSFNASSNTYALTVTPGATRILPPNPPLPPVMATPFNLGVILTMNSFGVMPSCNFTFYDGTTALQGTPNCDWQANGPFLYVSLPVSQTTVGTHTYTAKFNGDSNYAPSTSAPMTTKVFYGTTTTLFADSTNIQYGTGITLTAVVDSTVSQGPPIGQSVTFSFNNNPVAGTVTYTPFTDPSGNIALRATLTTVPQSSGFYTANFAGDTNYFQSGALLDVNVSIPDFSLAANLPTLSITAGNSATATITVTPLSNSSSPVTLSCPANGGTPFGVTCSFSPATVNLSNGNAATSTLTISTLPPSSSTTTSSAPVNLPRFYSPPRIIWPLPVSLALTLFFLLLLTAHRCRNRFVTSLALACGFCLLLSFFGCGGGSAGGGGGGGPTPSSITFSVSTVKVPFGTALTLTANVTSSKTPGGTVTFFVDAPGGYANNAVVNGVAQIQINYLTVGTHVFKAQYTGDANTLGSQTAGSLNVVVTGQTGVTVFGNTGGLSHLIGINFNLQ